MNKKSGVLGVSQIGSDLRDIEAGYFEGRERETLVLEMYTNAILKTIGGYAALLWGVDAIVFTAGVLENSALQRKLIAERLNWMWVDFDESVHNLRGEEREITTPASKVKVIVIPTDEELMIAKDTYELAKA